MKLYPQLLTNVRVADKDAAILARDEKLTKWHTFTCLPQRIVSERHRRAKKPITQHNLSMARYFRYTTLHKRKEIPTQKTPDGTRMRIGGFPQNLRNHNTIGDAPRMPKRYTG